MSDENKSLNKLLAKAHEASSKPKFLPKNIPVTLYLYEPFDEETIDGKFGKQKMTLIKGKTSQGKDCIWQVSESQLGDIVEKFEIAGKPKVYTYVRPP